MSHLYVKEASRADAGQETEGDTPPSSGRARWGIDLVVGLAYVLAAGFVTGHLWANLSSRTVENEKDQVFFMLMLRHGARVLTMGADPFFTRQFNAPTGVNLMANTSALGLTLPISPVTVLFGPRVAFALLLVVGLAGTAFAWYTVLKRVVTSRAAAIVGGGFCGFGPGMISHADGHVNWVCQFLVPFMVLAVVRLARPGKTVRWGLALGLLVVLQAFINEEVLLYTVIGCAVFLLAYAAFLLPTRAGEVGASAVRIAAGLAVGSVVSLAVLAYPLFVQFFGPQAYHGLPGQLNQQGSDLATYWSFSRMSLAGRGTQESLAMNLTEENSFFGWPLLAMMLAGLAWVWRRILARAITVTALVFLVLGLGPTLVVSGRDLKVQLPWATLVQVPMFDSVLPTRFSLALVPLFGVGLALVVQRVSEVAHLPFRGAGYVVVAAALVPLLPVPLLTADAAVTPAFIADGTWRSYVPDTGTLVPVTDDNLVGMTWLADSNADFAMTGGYFLGPDDQGKGRYNAFPVRPTTRLIKKVAKTGRIPKVTDQMRLDLRADLASWGASAMVLPPHQAHGAKLRKLVDELTGQTGRQVDGVVVWPVRGAKLAY